MLMATDTMLALHRALRAERMTGIRNREDRRRSSPETVDQVVAVRLGRTVAAR